MIECSRRVFSPYPEETVEYSTLFCRMITANASSLRLRLRDFPIALLEIARLSVWGRLLGAEETGRTTGTFLVDICLLRYGYSD